MTWLTATGTSATSTSAFALTRHSPITSVTPLTISGAGSTGVDFPYLLANGKSFIFKIYNVASLWQGNSCGNASGGNAPGCIAATSTTATRGFDPILKFDYQTVDSTYNNAQ